jgi:hypothetical protein
MFNENDINNIGKDPNSIPDGVIDATEFYEDLVFLSKQLEETDYESMDSKMKTMMNVINYYHNQTEDNSIDINTDKLYGITIGLLFHMANLFVGMGDEGKVEYWEYINNELLPTMKEEKTILPYWDNDE